VSPKNHMRKCPPPEEAIKRNKSGESTRLKAKGFPGPPSVVTPLKGASPPREVQDEGGTTGKGKKGKLPGETVAPGESLTLISGEKGSRVPGPPDRLPQGFEFLANPGETRIGREGGSALEGE